MSKMRAEKVETPSAPAEDGTCQTLCFDPKRVATAQKNAMSAECVQDVADVFKVLAHPKRVRLIRALALEELCVCDLAQVLELSVSATSHQLQALRKSKILSYQMKGKLAYYRLRNPFILALIEDCIRHVGAENES